jgi:hypothetical protein
MTDTLGRKLVPSRVETLRKASLLLPRRLKWPRYPNRACDIGESFVAAPPPMPFLFNGPTLGITTK